MNSRSATTAKLMAIYIVTFLILAFVLAKRP
jgi:hypothetical protein